jgi:hypothetical protein
MVLNNEHSQTSSADANEVSRCRQSLSGTRMLALLAIRSVSGQNLSGPNTNFFSVVSKESNRRESRRLFALDCGCSEVRRGPKTWHSLHSNLDRNIGHAVARTGTDHADGTIV